MRRKLAIIRPAKKQTAFLSLCLGLHPRLGRDSPIAMVGPDPIRWICEYLPKDLFLVIKITVGPRYTELGRPQHHPHSLTSHMDEKGYIKTKIPGMGHTDLFEYQYDLWPPIPDGSGYRVYRLKSEPMVRAIGEGLYFVYPDCRPFDDHFHQLNQRDVTIPELVTPELTQVQRIVPEFRHEQAIPRYMVSRDHQHRIYWIPLGKPL